MANSYASVADYESRYGTVADAARIQQLLDDAALFLDAAVKRHGIDADVRADALSMACCARARYIDERGDGTASRTQQAGPYSYTVSYQKGLKAFDAWLREQFGELLGIGGGGVACVAIGYADADA